MSKPELSPTPGIDEMPCDFPTPEDALRYYMELPCLARPTDLPREQHAACHAQLRGSDNATCLLAAAQCGVDLAYIRYSAGDHEGAHGLITEGHQQITDCLRLLKSGDFESRIDRKCNARTTALILKHFDGGLPTMWERTDLDKEEYSLAQFRIIDRFLDDYRRSSEARGEQARADAAQFRGWLGKHAILRLLDELAVRELKRGNEPVEWVPLLTGMREQTPDKDVEPSGNGAHHLRLVYPSGRFLPVYIKWRWHPKFEGLKPGIARIAVSSLVDGPRQAFDLLDILQLKGRGVKLEPEEYRLVDSAMEALLAELGKATLVDVSEPT